MQLPSLIGLMQRFAKRNQAYPPAVPLWVSGCLLLVLGLWLYFLFAGYAADVGGDAYTYARFGRLLGTGRIRIENSVADVFRSYMESPGTPQPLTWNTAMLPSGAWVYTVAPGFPLVLAAAYQIAGLAALMHANLLFQAGVALLFFTFLLLSSSRPTRWLCALAGTFGFFLLDPQTQHQFISLWREPLLFLLFLGSACALVLQHRYPRLYWAIPVLLGYATAVKESSLLYAAVLGGVLLSSPAFRAHPHAWRRILFGGVVFFLASAPLWIQNLYLTGRPWLSLYVARETAEYSATDAGMGLSAGNMVHTVARYVALYRPHAFWLIPFLLLAFFGLYRQRHTLAGRLMAAWFVAHVGLYIQWGNAEARHMYFVIFPLLFGVIHGMDLLLRQMTQRFPWCPQHATATVWATAATVCAFSLPVLHRPFQINYGFREWRAVAEVVQSSVPDDALILCNRWLRDIVGGYTSLGVTRLHSLEEGTGVPAARIVREQLQEGRAVYFLDNPDQSPGSVRRRTDLSRIDRKHIVEHHDLSTVRRITSDHPVFAARVGRSSFTIYRVQAWQNREFRTQWDVPAHEVAFLFLSPRAARDDIQIRVNNRPQQHDFRKGPFVPVTTRERENTVTLLRVEGMHSQKLPDFSDAAFIDWETPIQLPAGDTAIPDDQPWFPDGTGRQPFGDRRVFNESFRLRIPVREGDDLFTAIALHIKGLERIPVPFSAARAPAADYSYTSDRSPLWIPLPPVGNGFDRRALYRDITLHVPPGRTLQVAHITSHVVSRTIPIPEKEPGEGWLFFGYVMPMERHGRWRLDDGDRAWKNGQAGPIPEENPVALFYSADRQNKEDAKELRWHGAGLFQPDRIPVDRQFTLSADSPSVPFLSENLYHIEQAHRQLFRWTKPKAAFRLPVAGPASTYQLTLTLACHAPVERQEVSIMIDGKTIDQQRLTESPATLSYEIPVSDFLSANWITVELHVPGWKPADHGSPDARHLGVRWYDLQWTRMESTLND